MHSRSSLWPKRTVATRLRRGPLSAPGHRRASLIVPIGERALEVGSLVQALVCMGDRYISAALRAAYDANDGEWSFLSASMKTDKSYRNSWSGAVLASAWVRGFA